jgi:O-antigen/teichoic acid export membrane protein
MVTVQDAPPRKRSTLNRDIARTLAVRLVTWGMGIVTGAVTARLLGPHDRGLLALALILPGTIVMFAKLGIPQANIYFIRREPRSVDAVCSNALVMVMAVGTTLVVLAWLGRQWIGTMLTPGLPADAFFVALLMVPLFLHESFFFAILQALGLFRSFNGLFLAGGVLMSVGTIGVLVTLTFLDLHDWRLLGVLVVRVLVGVAIELAALVMVWRRTHFRFRFDLGHLGRAIQFGIKSHVQTLTQHLHLRIDIYMIALITLDPKQVAFYSLAARAAEMLLDIPDAVGVAVYPRLAARKDVDIHFLTAAACRRTMFVIAGLGVLMAIFAEPILVAWYGADYRPAAGPLPTIVVGVVMMSVFVLLTRNFTSRAKQGANIVVSGLSLAVNVSLNLLLIPRLGITGAALATMLSYSLATLYLAWLYLRESRLPVSVLIVPQPGDWIFFRERAREVWQQIARAWPARTSAAGGATLPTSDRDDQRSEHEYRVRSR